MEVPDKQFLKGCKLCTFMKVTTLDDVRDSLKYMRYEIEVPRIFAFRPRRALRRNVRCYRLILCVLCALW